MRILITLIFSFPYFGLFYCGVLFKVILLGEHFLVSPSSVAYYISVIFLFLSPIVYYLQDYIVDRCGSDDVADKFIITMIFAFPIMGFFFSLFYDPEYVLALGMFFFAIGFVSSIITSTVRKIIKTIIKIKNKLSTKRNIYCTWGCFAYLYWTKSLYQAIRMPSTDQHRKRICRCHNRKYRKYMCRRGH